MFVISQDLDFTGDVNVFARDCFIINAVVGNRGFTVGSYDSAQRAKEIIKEIHDVQTSNVGMYCSYVMPQE